MIKINKPATIPPSLALPNNGSTPNTTHRKRRELIENGTYIYGSTYDDRYKMPDIKTNLKAIYNNKCVFCEQKVEQTHVEHFRPKSTYYWLAFSWDNLLLACPTCNQEKKNTFEINGAQATYKSEYLDRIHSLSSLLDTLEGPKMMNPEITDPSGKLIFDAQGNISSSDTRIQHTIDTCQVNRTHLKDDRRKILDEYKEDITSELNFPNKPEDQMTILGPIIRKFIRASINPESQYIAFRKYAIDRDWMRDIIKKITP